MDDVRGLFLGMPHGTTPAAVTTNKNIIMSSFKSSGDIQKKEGGPDSCKASMITFVGFFSAYVCVLEFFHFFFNSLMVRPLNSSWLYAPLIWKKYMFCINNLCPKSQMITKPVANTVL